ncbi:coenzyme Q biosynthesis protein [Heterostelium album PN500]|uniref:Ubiquinone biosynthesis protein COQ4 homolog, mitochondrial n=1 Tax=Heterostelium pallidum (strain ATCC 26659 / Pp 5 / PN500) TaxID=670386 RepID=D3AWR4_HETP5|nr:coenzyme Q biosynthesis protein [Heterostelium album PN500]EFA86737.1 coenzyme Q biosynthesis protein [Heterostelium album PN500]|eukprot:XP_020438841.1 coenzyme Q biosynthesis protein [Heterostelium album PN500]
MNIIRNQTIRNNCINNIYLYTNRQASITYFLNNNNNSNNNVNNISKYNFNNYVTTTNDFNNNKQQTKIKNNLFQKVLLGVGSSIVAMINPGRGDMIATLGEITGGCALKTLKKKMMEDEVGRDLLARKPRIRSETFPPNLHLLPPTTFGGAYYHFMNIHGYSADERTHVRMIEDDDEAYIMQRYREVHDFWHVLAGVDTTVQGELAVKWLELLQTGLPMCAISAAVGPLRLPFAEQKVLVTHMIPWAVRCARNSKFLMNVRYEDHWETPIEDLRKLLNFEKYEGPQTYVIPDVTTESNVDTGNFLAVLVSDDNVASVLSGWSVGWDVSNDGFVQFTRGDWTCVWVLRVAKIGVLVEQSNETVLD